MKKKSHGIRFQHLATKKPLFFYSVLLAGAAFFIFLTLSIKIETVEGVKTLLQMILSAGK